MKSRETFFRGVSLFDPDIKDCVGKELFSFNASTFQQVEDLEGISFLIDTREQVNDSVVATGMYKATLLLEGNSQKLIIERYQQKPFLFVQMLLKKNWMFVDGEDKKLISFAGSHSLTMLISEFEARAVLEH